MILNINNSFLIILYIYIILSYYKYFFAYKILGGFVGLFLGYSFFNLILVVTDWMIRKIEKSMERNKIKTEEEEAQEKWRNLIQQLIRKEINEKEKKPLKLLAGDVMEIQRNIAKD